MSPRLFKIDSSRPVLQIASTDALFHLFILSSLNSIDVRIVSCHSIIELCDYRDSLTGCLVLDDRILDAPDQASGEGWFEQSFTVPVIVIANEPTVEFAVQTMKAGAFDFLQRSVEAPRLVTAVEAAFEHSKITKEKLKKVQDYEDRRSFLSLREEEVYQLLLVGMELKQLALKLSISTSTAEKHRLSVVRKMGTENVTQLIQQKFEATGTIHDSSFEKDDVQRKAA